MPKSGFGLRFSVFFMRLRTQKPPCRRVGAFLRIGLPDRPADPYRYYRLLCPPGPPASCWCAAAGASERRGAHWPKPEFAGRRRHRFAPCSECAFLADSTLGFIDRGYKPERISDAKLTFC